MVWPDSTGCGWRWNAAAWRWPHSASTRAIGGVGGYVTTVVPCATDDSAPVVRAYHRALANQDTNAVPGFVAFEGCLAGRWAIAGLERCGREVSRACLFESFRSAGPYDIEGFRLHYGAGDNQGSDQVFLTVLGPDANYHPAETLRDVPG